MLAAQNMINAGANNFVARNIISLLRGLSAQPLWMWSDKL